MFHLPSDLLCRSLVALVAVSLLFANPPAFAQAPDAELDVLVLEAFEAEDALAPWSTRQDAVLTLSEERATRGARSMRFASPGGAAAASAFRRLSAEETDWSGHRFFAFDVFNPGTSGQRLRIRFGDGANEVHTTQRTCPPGEWATMTVRTDSLEGLNLARMRYVRFYPPHIENDVVLYLDNLRLFNEPTVVVEATRRTAFRRMEEDALVEMTVFNRGAEGLDGGRLQAEFEDAQARIFDLPPIAPGEGQKVRIPVDARLRPGDYRLDVRVSFPQEGVHPAEIAVPVRIAQRPLPLRMRTFMLWGDMPLDMLQEVGLNTFTPGMMADTTLTWEADGPLDRPHDDERMSQLFGTLNEALARGLDVFSRCEAPARIARWRRMAEYYRVDADGNPYEDRIRQNVLHPDLQEYAHRFGASLARTFGDFPAFIGAFIHSEERGRTTAPAYDEHSRRAFREYAGLDIPSEVSGPRASRGIDYRQLDNFPEDRVIPDDHPIYVYYRWFWKRGDGWNPLNTQVHRGLEGMGRPDLWTMHAPVMRGASVYGSGGDLTHVGQWTYAHPGPLNYAMPTDQMFAMAAGATPPQGVAHTISVFTKRSYVMPAHRRQEAFFEEDAWVDMDPDGQSFPMTADQMRAGFWHIVSRPVDAVSFFGIRHLTGEYRNPELIPEMTSLLRGVLEPLGPTLLQVPDRPGDVAFLESFASEMFAGRGVYGWGFRGWAGTAYRALLHAHLQPRVFFEETIQRGGLNEGVRVLVMTHCDVLPRSVVDRVLAFQSRGGIVVGDEHLASAIRPDILIRSDTRDPASAEAPAELEKATELARALEGRYARYVECDDPEVIVRARTYGTADYVFVVNDRRVAGNYLGQHGVVREFGAPSSAQVAIARQSGHVYDLLAGRQVPATVAGGRLRLDVDLGPCEGRLFMVTERPVAAVRVSAPAEMRRGAPAEIRVEVVDGAGRPVDAVVPVLVDIADPQGRPAEFSGYYGAKDGQLTITLDPAPNDEGGTWTVTAKELATGKEAAGRIRLGR